MSGERMPYLNFMPEEFAKITDREEFILRFAYFLRKKHKVTEKRAMEIANEAADERFKND